MADERTEKKPVKAKKQPMPNPQINLDAEASQKAANEAMEAAQQLAFLSRLLEAGTCSPSSVETHLKLTRGYYDNLSAMLGGKGVLDKEHAELTRMLREANEKARSLERAVGQKAEFETVISGFKILCEAFESWYSLSGFHYANVQHSPYGLTADFSDELEHYESQESRVFGHFGDKTLKHAIVSCCPGLDLDKMDIRVDGTRHEMLDTEKNKKYLRDFILLSFPEARITGFKSNFDQGDYTLRFSIHVTWPDLNAWKQRMLETARTGGKARTGRVYLARIDAKAKLASKTWTGYATPDMLEETQANLQHTESLISYYEGILQMTDNIERANAMAKFLADNGLDLVKDFEGDLYG